VSTGIVAEIKSKLPVVEIVGESVALKRAGAMHKGLCPFHGEKTPSFVVTPERETWHCFGCGEHGDIFTFVMRRDGVGFRDALKLLAERAGVELSERASLQERRIARLREALEAAVAWYREVLLQAHQAERARSYLAERQLTEETLERFGIGYAPNTWDALTRRLRAKGFTDAELVDAGLASRSTRGGVYDRFRARIMIPIRDVSGRAMGFGGRILPGAEGPKYLNSPATAVFDKSRTLYAIDLAKQAIRREKLAVIVEGYTDVMAAHQAGFANVVASLGTALTRGQVELATRYADAVALAYDVDLAGEAATQRGLLEELGPDAARKVRVVRVPDGKDPDELIRNDPEAWRAAIDETKEKELLLLDYFLERETRRVMGAGLAARLAAAERLLRPLAQAPDARWRGTFIQEIARRLELDERDVRSLVGAARQQRQAIAVAPSDTLQRLGALDGQALKLLVEHPSLVDRLPVGERHPLRDEAARAIGEAWLAAVRAAGGQRPESDRFMADLDPDTAELARSLLASADGEPRLDAEKAGEALRECLLRLQLDDVEERMRNGRLLLEDAQRDGDHKRLESYEHRMNELGRQKDQLTRALREPAMAAGGRRN
jgi:DNA primase